MLQEPLLVVAAFYILFFTVIIYVRLDFSITKVPSWLSPCLSVILHLANVFHCLPGHWSSPQAQGRQSPHLWPLLIPTVKTPCFCSCDHNVRLGGGEQCGDEATIPACGFGAEEGTHRKSGKGHSSGGSSLWDSREGFSGTCGSSGVCVDKDINLVGSSD